MDMIRDSLAEHGKETLILIKILLQIYAVTYYIIDMKRTNSHLQPLPKGDKIVKLVSILQDYIIKGNLKPGMEILPERRMAAQLGVSRFSLREALRVAQSQGLIEIRRGRKPRVAHLSSSAAIEIMSLTLRRSENALLDLVEARQILECGIARLSAIRAKPEHIAKMRKIMAKMNDNRDKFNVCVDCDTVFHEALSEASGNNVFEVMLKPLAELLKDSRRKTMQANGVDVAIRAHEAILAAVERHDGEEAEKQMAIHLELAEYALKKSKD